MANISIRDLSLSFPLYNLTGRSLKKTLFNISTGGYLHAGENNVVTVDALRDINIEIEHGDRIGLIGHNGAGKSSLLKVISAIYPPSKGSIEVKGKITPLLNITLGMDDEATGYENIYIRGLFLGLRRQKINQMIPDIEEFSELGNYLSMPIRTYSSGMKLRLAFAISTSIDAEILLMDEIIGVGDAKFLEKAQKRLNEVISNASIFVLASHSNDIIKNMCNKAILLEHGLVKAMGNVDEIIKRYEN